MTHCDCMLCAHILTRARAHTHIQIHILTHIRTCTRASTLTLTHTHIMSHTHTVTHAYIVYDTLTLTFNQMHILYSYEHLHLYTHVK